MTPEERAEKVLCTYLGTKTLSKNSAVGPVLLSIIASAIRDAERAATERAWNTVNALIKSGNLEEPYHSERNGLISAANAIRQSQDTDIGGTP